MTAELTLEASVEAPTGSLDRLLSVVAVGALVLAVAAGIYRHEERSEARRAAARSVVVARETQDLEGKITSARANLAATRGQLRARTPSSAALLQALDQLNANHMSMSSIVHEQDALSAGIVDALAGGHYATYNDLADRFRTATGTVDALATTERNLRDQLARTTCGDNCVAVEATAEFPDG
jgi:septal ring factor EnvC (AmiA/AmiB activator)